MNGNAKAVSPAEGAAMCGISRTKFYELLNKEIPIRKVGRRSLILVSDIDRWLNSLPISKSSYHRKEMSCVIENRAQGESSPKIVDSDV